MAGLRGQEREAAVGHDVLALVDMAGALRAEALPVGVGAGDREHVVDEPEALAAGSGGAHLRRARADAARDGGGDLEDVAPVGLRDARDRSVPIDALHAAGSHGRDGEVRDGHAVARAHDVDGDVDRRGPRT